jgi:hypothetical protein
MITMHPILNNQNSPELIKLLKASTVAYTNAKKGEIKVTFFLIFLAFAFPITYVLIKDEGIKLTLFGCSFLLTVLVNIFTDTFKGNTSKGAIFKEEFDTELFNLRWKSTLMKPEHSEVSKFSLEYKGKKIKDWYSPNISARIPQNIAIAVLQHSNTSWDIELRIIYRRCLTGFLISYSIVLWIFLISNNTAGITIFLIYFSLLSFYNHFITLIRGHSSVIESRKAISKHLDEIILSKKYIGIEELRDIQDEIYISRQETAKVPNFFFRCYQRKINAFAEDYIERVNKTWD